MDISKVLREVVMAGLPNSLRAVRYTRARDAIEKRFAPPRASGEFESPGQMVESNAGQFRFERAELDVHFLADDLARITWTPGAEPVPYAIAKNDWPGATVTRAEEAGAVLFSTARISLRMTQEGALTFRDAEGNMVHEALAPQRRGAQWRQTARLQPNEHFYGLGERAAPLNLSGGLYQLWNQAVGGIYTTGHDPLFLSIPVYIGQHTGGSYLIFFENTHQGVFDARGPESATIQFEGGAFRYYLTLGDIPQLIERYTELTGRPPLPPRWGLGYHHAVVAYRTEAEVQAAAEGFRQRNLPLSAIHMDLDYMDGFRTFTIDARRFPHLKTIAHDLLKRDVHLIPIIDTAVKVDPRYHVYASGLAAEAFCKLPDGKIMQAPVWPGEAVFPDFTDPKARAWWGTHYPEFLETGVSGFWHDMNEPEAFTAWGDRTLPLPTRHALEGRGGDHREAHNVYALNMNRAGYDALRNLRPQHRPWLLTRAGFAGIQRYAWSWTGDIESSWQGLRQTIATVLGLGLSGLPYTGPDTGGFYGNPTPELYIRWFQLSAFLPFFRTMSAFTTPRREPWHFGEQAVNIAREFLKLRYRLLPYWYTLAWEASQTGHPMVRPIFWPTLPPSHSHLKKINGDESHDALPHARPLRIGEGRGGGWAVDDAFLIGNNLLLAPVLENGTRAQEVALPVGMWYSFWDDVPQAGRTRVETPLERVPLFVRAGSLLPTEEDNTLTLHLYAPAENSEHTGELYCDAGDGYGDSLINRFVLRRVGQALELTWARTGQFAFPYAQVEIRVHGASVARVVVDGAEVECVENAVRLGGVCEKVKFELSEG